MRPDFDFSLFVESICVQFYSSEVLDWHSLAVNGLLKSFKVKESVVYHENVTLVKTE